MQTLGITGVQVHRLVRERCNKHEMDAAESYQAELLLLSSDHRLARRIRSGLEAGIVTFRYRI